MLVTTGQKKRKGPDLSGPFVLYRTNLDCLMVPEAGIEPARLAALDFESSASTNFTTPAKLFASLIPARFAADLEVPFISLK